MESFKSYLSEQEYYNYLSHQYETLFEQLIAPRGVQYPKFGHIVIMAGGAGSGKGYIQSKLLGIEGKTFDVDKLKQLAIKTSKKGFAHKLNKMVQDRFGVDLKDLDLKRSEDTAALHTMIGDVLGIPNKAQQAFFASAITANPERKPNIIFDVTLKNMKKLDTITSAASNMGYDKKNIHIVWVVNELEVAMKQNKSRDRVVRDDILLDTHLGASMTMRRIIDHGKDLRHYMDGMIVFAFNKLKVDSKLVQSGKGGEYIEKGTAEFEYIKEPGKPPLPYDAIKKDVLDKIKSYVPNSPTWGLK